MTTPTTSTRWIPDNSAVQCFRESPETFRLKYRLHLHPATPNDKMNAGSAIHAGRNILYSWRAGVLNGTNVPLHEITYNPDIIEEAVRVARAHRGEAAGARNADQVEQVVRTYAAKYAVEPFAVVESERYVEAKIHGPDCGHDGVACEGLPFGRSAFGCFDFCGIIDAVVRFADGSEYVMDLKSTGAYLNSSWEDAMRLGDQFVGYVAMRRARGHRCDGFFVDGIHMRDAKPRKDGSIGTPSVDEDDFVRVGPVGVPEWRVMQWAADMRYTLRAIAELEATRGIDAPWPRYQNWMYGKVDEYKDFYDVPPELHASIFPLFVRREWSPQAVAEERAVGANLASPSAT